MKWTGISLLTGIALWFRMPRSIPRTTVRAAFVAMAIFAAAIGAMLAFGWYFKR